jgi:hypothetical protein
MRGIVGRVRTADEISPYSMTKYRNTGGWGRPFIREQEIILCCARCMKRLPGNDGRKVRSVLEP